MFPNAKGNPVISSNFWNNHFAKAQQHVGVTCRFHDLRHTSVALAFASGVNPKAIQTRMGHSSITVTLTGMATSSLSSTKRSPRASAQL